MTTRHRLRRVVVSAGSIATEAEDPSSSTHSPGRKSDAILVEFTDPAVGVAVCVMSALKYASDSSVEVRRVPIDNLQHMPSRHCT